MKRLVKKLRSDGGASLLFAMLVFALCALAGTVMLTSAAANVGRYTHLEAEQQQYLSVASALDLLQAQMDEKPVTVKLTYTEIYTWSRPPGDPSGMTENTTCTLALTEPDLSATGAELGFYQKLMLLDPACVPEEWYDDPNRTAGSYARPTAPTGTETKEYTVDLDEAYKGVDGAAYLYKVNAEYTEGTADTTGGPVDPTNYSLTLVLSAEGEDGKYYPIQVVWPGEVTTERTTTVTTTGDTTADSGTRTTTTVLTCTLKWSKENRVITFVE